MPRKSPVKSKTVAVRKSSTRRVVDRELDMGPDVVVHPPALQHLALYRRLAVGFVLVVLAILGVVVFMSVVKATITVHAKGETVKTEFLMDVVKTPTRESEVRGRILSSSMGKSKTFAVTSEGAKEVEGVARGTVVIKNTTSQDQTLVKTTRLLTEDGKLFRIDATVNVPAKGSVSVEAYADQPGKFGDIAPSNFTIPGLPESLRKLITAENPEAFKGGLSTVSVVTQAELDRASTELKQSIEDEVKTVLRTQAGDVYGGESFSSSVIEEARSVEPGTETAEFSITMSLKVTGVFFDRSAVEEVANRKLYDLLIPGKEFRSINTDGLSASVEKVDTQGEMANVRVYLDGVVVPSANNPALNPGLFVGQKGEEVAQHIVASGLAERVDVEFFPPWIGTIPHLKDHVDIIVK